MTSFDEIRRQKTTERDALIKAALPHVPFDGWSAKTLKSAAVSAGLGEEAAVRLFPGGAKDAVAHFQDMADRMMLEDLAAVDLAAMKIRARVTLAVRTRLERWTPYREAVRCALALSPLPQFAGGSLRGWYKTVDAIWRICGDRATDFNFYTKRGLLAGVYASTLLFWLDDRSENRAATWAFLDRRIANVIDFPKWKAKVTEGLKALPDPRSIMARIARRRPSSAA